LRLGTGDLNAPPAVGRRRFLNDRKGTDMAKLWAVLLLIASFVLVAPVVESGSSNSMNLFVAVGNAEGGGGGE
jgi:hypothetical protein